MSDQNDSTSTSTEETKGQAPEGTTSEQSEGDQPEGGTGESTDETGKAGESKLSLEDALKEVTRTRAEAANYRTRLREAEESLKAAKTPEEFATATEALAARNAELERELLVTKVAGKHKLPDELTATLSALKHLTDDELEQHATTLAKFAVTEDPEPDTLLGGLTPGSRDETSDDPRALARQFGRGRRKA